MITITYTIVRRKKKKKKSKKKFQNQKIILSLQPKSNDPMKTKIQI